jgi:N-acetylglutamate synthase-like GNAT family acetyltransferase
MGISLHEVYNTFSIYQRIRSKRYDTLLEEVSKHFSIVEIPKGNEYHLHIFKNGEAVGMLTMIKEATGDIIRLKHLCITPEAQALAGIEQHIMMYAENWAKGHKFQEAIIYANKLGIPFYLKLNYRQTGETVHENGRLCYKMVKKI